MSKTLIKNFFEASRKRQKITHKKEKQIVVEQPKSLIDILRSKYALETIKNWEYSQLDLISFYNNLDENDYQYILSNRNELNFETKAILWPEEFNPPLGRNSHLKVKELTHEGYIKLLIEKIKRQDKLINERMEKITISPIHTPQFDDKILNLNKTLLSKQKNLEDAKKNIDVGKYVTPSKRTLIVEKNPVIIALDNSIKEIKNEIEKTLQRVKILNDEWERNEKFKLRQKIEQEIVMSGL